MANVEIQESDNTAATQLGGDRDPNSLMWRVAEEEPLAGLDTLVISVEGATAASQAEVRGRADLNQVQRQIRKLHALRRVHRRANPEIGLEFAVTRRNLAELPSLRRLAHVMEATFVAVTKVLPYTHEFKEEILYRLASISLRPGERSRWNPEILLPRMDARPEVLEPLLGLWRYGGTIYPLPGHAERGYG